MWSRDQRAIFACCAQLELLALGSLSFLTSKEHPDMPFSHIPIWKLNGSDDLLMTEINKPRESWHHYSLRKLSEVKWQYYSSRSALSRVGFCFNCMSGLCCEPCWLAVPATICFVHRLCPSLLFHSISLSLLLSCTKHTGLGFFVTLTASGLY